MTRRRTSASLRSASRALSCHAQAVSVLRWFLDATRVAQLGAITAAALVLLHHEHDLT